jgi:hypothetical protein
MFISITSRRVSKAQSAQLEGFLETFLPKMRQFSGVKAIFHYARPDKEDDCTVVICESEIALDKYRESDLIKEVNAFEKKINLPGNQEAYPLLLSL